MKIKLIDFGVREDWRPYRPHGNDAGADVYMPYDCTLKPGDVEKVPLGFGIEVPDGYAGYVFPRSSMAARGSRSFQMRRSRSHAEPSSRASIPAKPRIPMSARAWRR